MKLASTYNASAQTAEILIYGPIGASFWDDSGITAKDFTEALNEIPKGTQITVGINSQGGAIGEGLAIYNAIERRADEITARIDGYALSAGSFIPLAASKVVSPKSAVWMIHKGWSVAQGNADEMRKAADLLDKHDETLIGLYESKTGKSRDEIAAALAAETWLTGEEAVAWGLADTIGGDTNAQAMACVDFNKAPAGSIKNHKALKTILAAVSGTKNQTAESSIKPDETTATLSAPHSAVAVVEPKPAVNTATKEQNMSENIAPVAADKSAEILAKLEALEAKINTKPEAAAEPVKSARIEVGGTVMDEYRKLPAGSNRAEFRAARHAELLRQSVQGANTLSSSLVPDALADSVVTVAHNKLAYLNAFSQDFGIDEMRPKATVQVPKATAGATAQSDATNFESGDSTLTNIGVSVAQKSVSFHLTNTQLNQGYKLNQIATINANVLCDTISDVVTALMVTGTYGTAVTIGAAANFDSADLPPIYAAAKNYNRKNLILDGGHLAYLLPTNKWQFALGEAGAFGFDLIAENNRWTSATANTVGFICDPSAIAVASGLPTNSAPAGEFISQSTVALKNGMTVQVNVWFSRASRALWTSYDVMFGAAAGDTTAAELLITA